MILLTLGIAPATASAEDAVIRFGAPPWPGATVKAEVVTQLLDALGYEAEIQQLGTEAIILNALASDDLDVYLSLWLPLSAGNVKPFLEDGTIAKLAINMQGAVMGLAVPEYVHEAGVDSIEDLARHAEKFDRTIYGIEPGNYWNQQVKKLIQAGKYGLGDWEMIPSSTPAMLTQVDRASKKGEWIVFYGWRPHWMNIPYDLYYLTAPDGSVVADVESTIWTVAGSEFATNQPDVARFLRQLYVDARAQSEWILAYGKNERPAEEVAREWIRSNLQEVRLWFDGVTTTEGEPAMQAIMEEFPPAKE